MLFKKNYDIEPLMNGMVQYLKKKLTVQILINVIFHSISFSIFYYTLMRGLKREFIHQII
jgi:hypothetical protein